MSDVDIVLEIATKGVEEVYKLSNAMTQLNRAVSGVSNPMKNLDARSRALSQAVGSADSSLKSHAKTLGQVARNNAVLTNEMGRVRKEIAGLGKEFSIASDHSAAFSRAGIKDLKNYEKALKGIRLGALSEDLKGVAQEQKRLGKDAQFVGRSLIIGLTTPILAFGRYGLQSLVAVDKEFVRLNKIV
jgi:chromosome segregation ATPase